MAINNYSIGDYWLFFYWGHWLLLIVNLYMVILLMAIGSYFINGYW
jgi:hypothetical protein